MKETLMDKVEDILDEIVHCVVFSDNEGMTDFRYGDVWREGQVLIITYGDKEYRLVEAHDDKAEK